MIRVLLDQGLPRSAANLLRSLNWDAQHVGERGMSRAEDATILEVARQEGRIVVTLDADFHALLAISAAEGPSVLRIRMEGLKADAIAALVERVFASVGRDLACGALVTVQEGKVRVKRLPITK